jgi:hypothetical protein
MRSRAYELRIAAERDHLLEGTTRAGEVVGLEREPCGFGPGVVGPPGWRCRGAERFERRNVFARDRVVERAAGNIVGIRDGDAGAEQQGRERGARHCFVFVKPVGIIVPSARNDSSVSWSRRMRMVAAVWTDSRYSLQTFCVCEKPYRSAPAPPATT